MRHRRLVAGAAAFLVVGLAACGGTAPASVAPSVAATTAPTTAPTEAPTTAPAETVAPSPTEAAAGEDVSAILAPAVLATLEAGSATFDISMAFNDSAVIPAGTTLSGGGPMEFGADGRGAMELDLTSLGAGRFSMIQDPPVLYIAMAGAPSSLIPEGKWARIDGESTSPLATQLRGVFSGANDASSTVRYLLGSDGTGTIGEPEAINGVQATPVSTVIDLEAARDAAPDDDAAAAIQELIDQQVSSGVGTVLPAVAWVGEDGLIHRIDLTYELAPAAGGGTMLASFELSDHGAPVELDLPGDEDVVDIDELTPGG